MLKILRVYKQFLLLNISANIAYRTNFINGIISGIAWGVFSILIIVLLTDKTSSVYGWTREELIILTTSYSIIVGTFQMLFSRNFNKLAEVIHFGQLDGYLLKPIDSQFIITTREINYSNLFRVVIAVMFNVYMLQRIGVEITLLSTIAFIFFTFFSIMLLYSIWFIILSLTIWYSRLSNLLELLYDLTGVARYPREMFLQIRNYLIYFLLPLTFIVTVPTKTLLQRLSIDDIVGLMIFSLCFFLFSRFFWNFALRHYTSASS